MQYWRKDIFIHAPPLHSFRWIFTLYPLCREYSSPDRANIIKITSEVVFIISYEPLWSAMRRKGVTTYTLIKDYSFSRGTLDSLKHNRNISTATLNDLCNILSCRVEDVLVHTPDEA